MTRITDNFYPDKRLQRNSAYSERKNDESRRNTRREDEGGEGKQEYEKERSHE
jgi:hypothetical protein